MAAKATISSGYRWRLGLVAVVLLAVACWFFYDAVIGYPAVRRQQIAMKTAYEQLKVDHPGNYTERWPTVAKEHGWSTDQQPGDVKSKTDILAQYLYGGVCVIVALPFGFVFLRSFGRWVASDERGLSTSWGQQAAWSQLRSVDTARWKTKGIAKVHYEDDSGAKRALTLDDWKFESQPVATIFNEVRESLGIDAGEPALPPPAQETETEAAAADAEQAPGAPPPRDPA